MEAELRNLSSRRQNELLQILSIVLNGSETEKQIASERIAQLGALSEIKNIDSVNSSHDFFKVAIRNISESTKPQTQKTFKFGFYGIDHLTLQEDQSIMNSWAQTLNLKTVNWENCTSSFSGNTFVRISKRWLDLNDSEKEEPKNIFIK